MKAIHVLGGGVLATACLLAGAGAAVADADSLSDTMGARELGVGEAVRAASYGATAITANPAGISLAKGTYVLEGSYGFRGSDDAAIERVSICDATHPVGACIYYNHFSSSPPFGMTKGSRTLHEAGMALSVPMGEHFFIGANGKYVDNETKSIPGITDASKSTFIMDGGLVLKTGPYLNVALVGYNLIGHDKDFYPEGVGGGLAVYPTQMIQLSADAVWNLDAPSGSNTGRFSGGAEYVLSSDGGQAGIPLRVGYIHDRLGDRSYFTAGLGYITPKLALDAGMRKETGGGDETTIQIGLRLFLPN